MNDTNHSQLRERLAAIEHERWADWQSWCHKILREQCPSPELEKVLARWDKQIATPYDQLSDAEKASDMEQVDRYWQLVDEAIQTAKIDAVCQVTTDGHDAYYENVPTWRIREQRAAALRGAGEGSNAS